MQASLKDKFAMVLTNGALSVIDWSDADDDLQQLICCHDLCSNCTPLVCAVHQKPKA